jgi:ankyrin repeat protein
MLKKLAALGFCVVLFTACSEPPLDPTNPESIRRHYAKLEPPVQMSNDQFVSYVKASQATIEKDTMNMSMFLVCSKDYLNTPNSKGNSALSVAVNKKNPVVVKYLLDRGADFNVKSEQLKNMTPLEDASTRADSLSEVILSMLIEAQKQKDPELLNIGIALHLAANYGHAKNVELLAEGGTNINAKNKEGFTPLHEAAKEGRKPVVEYLITKKVQLNPTDNDGFTPIDWAVQYGIGTDGKGAPFPEIADILKKAGGTHTEAWKKATKR